jgi:hypothetical protein
MNQLLNCLVLLLAFVLSSFTSPDGEGCRKCEHRGVQVCPEHTDEHIAYEGDVLFCSTVARCESCAGALLVDCERCEGGPDNHLIPERQTAVAEWLKKQEVSTFMGRVLPAVETERFQLIVETGSLRIDLTRKNRKKQVDQHTLMHQIARDLLQIEKSIEKHFELAQDEDQATKQTELQAALKRAYSAKMRLWIWGNLEDHRKVMQHYMGSTSTGDFKLLEATPVFSGWTEKVMNTGISVRQAFSHNAVHMLLSNVFEPMWPGDSGGGWFDAGSAHWYEYDVHKQSTVYCIEEATLPLDYEGGVWRRAIRKRLSKEATPFVPYLLGRNTGAMTLPEQALCWSLYDWFVAKHPAALPIIWRGLKKKQPSRDLIKQTIGMNLLQVEEAWRTWVAQTYPLKGDKPLTPKPSKKKRKR